MKPVFLFLLAPFSAALTSLLVGWVFGGLLAIWAAFCVLFLALYPFQRDLERRRQFTADRHRFRLNFWQYALASVVGGSFIALLFYQFALTRKR